MPDPLSPSGSNFVLVLQGNNNELIPEESTNWTFGVDFQPEALPGLDLSITYFDIDFTDRIAQPIPVGGGGFFQALVNEANHPSIVNRSPDLAEVTAWFADPGFINITGGPVSPSDIGAIVNNQLGNVAGVLEKGFDFNANYSFDTDIGSFSVRFGGTYLTDKQHKVTPESPSVEQLNLVRAPVDLKLRNSVAWTRDDLAVTLFINYVDSYKNPLPSGVVNDVNSWTTADLTFRYETEEGNQWLEGAVLSFNVLNVTNKRPPALRGDTILDFDATNANALGRFISIDLTKHW